MDPELLQASRDLATSVGGALVAKPLLERLLGPSFQYVGHSLAGLLERYGNKRLAEIFCRAAEKLQSDSTSADRVNPRVLRTIIEDGSFADDEVTREYYAGLLAASVRGDGTDDRAITFLTIIRTLTNRQIRCHHLIYSWIRTLHHGYSVFNPERAPRLFIADRALSEHQLIESEIGKAHLLAGLSREALIGGYKFRQHTLLVKERSGLDGCVIDGSSLGAQLFLWVHGQPDAPPDDIFHVPLTDWSAGPSRWVLGGPGLRQWETVVELFQRARAATDDPSAWDEKSQNTVREVLYHAHEAFREYLPERAAGEIGHSLEIEPWSYDEAFKLHDLSAAVLQYLTGREPD